MQEKRERPSDEPRIQRRAEDQRLREKTVRDLTAEKRRLVEVPYTASLADTMNTLVANRVTALPVAAPPGHWIGAGGSLIVESDKVTGAVRKHYIGMVTMLDVLHHIADGLDANEEGGNGGFDARMSVPVSSIIGNCLEGLSLWTLNPNTSILDSMEVFSKGIHRALVPVDSHMENISGAELQENASSYRMLTQMDVLRFLKENASELRDIVAHTVGELGVVTEDVFAVTHDMKITEAMKCMRAASLSAVPIVERSSGLQGSRNNQLIDGKGKKLVGTFSATDLRECSASQLQSWLHLSVIDFMLRVSTSPSGLASTKFKVTNTRELVTCNSASPLEGVIDRAVSRHVHRVWVVDRFGLLAGLVSLTDVIRVIRFLLAC